MIGNTETNAEPVTVRLPGETIARLDEMASRTYRKRSDLLRLAVDTMLEDGAEVATDDAGKEVGE
jgi:predicted transcriptional regulator